MVLTIKQPNIKPLYYRVITNKIVNTIPEYKYTTVVNDGHVLMYQDYNTVHKTYL